MAGSLVYKILIAAKIKKIFYLKKFIYLCPIKIIKVMMFCKRIIFFDKKNLNGRTYRYEDTTVPLKASIYLDSGEGFEEGKDKCGEAFLSKDLCGVLAIVDRFDDNDIGNLARRRVLRQGYTLVSSSAGTVENDMVKNCKINYLYLSDEPSFVK